MFTGLVEALATVREVVRSGPGARLSLQMDLGPLTLGESVAVDGACLTVSRVLDGGFVADVSAESLAVTTLGALSSGQRVNVERAMLLGGRLGGHLVMGHVDGIATVTAVEQVGEARRISAEAPPRLARFLATKGSVTLDGVSLTINHVDSVGRFQVMLVPHTQSETTLSNLRAGQRLNIEVDVLARYAARLLEAAGVVPAPKDEAADTRDSSMLAALQRGGYV